MLIGIAAIDSRSVAVVSACLARPRLAPMTDRIVLETEEIAGLIRGARLLELRVDTEPAIRERYLAAALTAMDALCGLADRTGTDAVWDCLALLEHRELLAFATLMASELSETAWRGVAG